MGIGIGERGRSDLGDARELRRLKWVAVLAPLLFLGALEVGRLLYPVPFRGWPGILVLPAVVLGGTFLFAEAVFGVVGDAQRRLAQQNRELLALHEAGLGILGELEPAAVLQKVVDRARELAGANAGALSLIGEGGEIEAFLTSGGAHGACAMGTPDGADGAVPTTDGTKATVRCAFAAGGPLDPASLAVSPVRRLSPSLLAVPIRSADRVLGTLYLAEKANGAPFAADDAETLERFATQAALAIENARLHRRVRALAITEERERIAREMHDSLAQVLGYVNTKAQAAKALLANGDTDRAAAQLGQLAEAARAAYADVREGILGLRTSPDRERGFADLLGEHLARWQEQSGVRVELDAPADALPALSPLAEVQLLRIVQEALTNVRKHAGAARAWVRLRPADGALAVEIEDDGAGFDPDGLGRTAFPRFGLATMRERAEAAGGSFEVDAAPGRGTRVRVRIPTEPATAGG
jgi:signal transduction histidine kinase